MALSMAGFVANDTLIKLVSTELPLFQAVFLRGLAATLLPGLLAWRREALTRPSRRDLRVPGWRSPGELGGTICYLNALFHMPIANATAILQAMPLAITLAAALFLREAVGWRRWSAILAGFAGVLAIVRPGAEAFDAYALWALAAVGFMTLRDLATRRLSPAMPSLFAALVASGVIAVMSGLAAATLDWRPVSGRALAALGVAALCIVIGYLFIIMAMRSGDIGFVAPFRYLILLLALVIGVAVFDEIPDAASLSGAAVVVAAGYYAFRRERRLARPD